MRELQKTLTMGEMYRSRNNGRLWWTDTVFTSESSKVGRANNRQSFGSIPRHDTDGHIQSHTYSIPPPHLSLARLLPHKQPTHALTCSPDCTPGPPGQEQQQAPLSCSLPSAQERRQDGRRRDGVEAGTMAPEDVSSRPGLICFI